MTATPPLAQHFAELEGTLWRVAGTLARRGYVAAPEEARDLIHDFFLDVWPRLNETYDPAQGPLAAYAAEAFYRFGRRKLAALNAIRHRLVELDDIAHLSSTEPTPAEHAERQQQIRSVQAAMDKLPALQRQVLTDYLAGAAQGEYRQAHKYGLSRYAYRDVLVDAVGRIAADFASVAASPIEQQILRLLWKEGRSAQQAAKLLDLDTRELQTIKQAYARRLLQSMKGKRHGAKEENMSTSSLAALFERALAAPGNAQALEQLRLAAEEHWSRVRSDPSAPPLDEVLGERLPPRIPTHWLACVYEAIAPASDAREDALSGVLQHIAQSEDREIGEAVAVLVQSLPATLHPVHWLADLHLSAAEREHYTSDETLRYTWGDARSLAEHGITPRAVAECAAGFSLLFARSLRSEPDRLQPAVDAETIEIVAGSMIRHLSWHRIHGQTALISDLPLPHVSGLSRWLLHVCGVRPYLVEGFRCEQFPRGFRFLQLPVQSPLDQSVSRPTELMARWSRTDFRD